MEGDIPLKGMSLPCRHHLFLSFNMNHIVNIIKHILDIMVFAYISGKSWGFEKFILAPVSEQSVTPEIS